jgi:hypothetical protein
MTQQHRSFPFRWVLPVVQLVVCFVILWPVRRILFFETRESVHPIRTQRVLILPSWTPEREGPVDDWANISELRFAAPSVLNFPVVVAQVPYLIIGRKEWVPGGMSTRAWRALCWPFAGLIFWWFSGRGLEALRSARRSIIDPRLGWIETVFAAIFSCVGIAMLIGVITTTPDDRADLQFMALLAGGCLWGVLAGMTLTARFMQWRIRRHSAVALLK